MKSAIVFFLMLYGEVVGWANVPEADPIAECVSHLRQDPQRFKVLPVEAFFLAEADQLRAAVDFFGMQNEYYRGIAQEGFGLPQLAEYLTGNRRYEIQSWDLTRLVQEKEEKFQLPLDSALAEAEVEILRRIRLGLDSLGPYDFIKAQAEGTLMSLPSEEKKGLAVPFTVHQEDAIRPTSIFGLQLALRSEVDLFVFVFVLRERAPRGLPFLVAPLLMNPAREYYVLSHVPKEDVAGVYLGWMPPKKMVGQWFYLEILARDEKGILSHASLHEAFLLPDGKLTKRADKTIAGFRKGTALSQESAKKDYPQLLPLIEMLQACMEQHSG